MIWFRCQDCDSASSDLKISLYAMTLFRHSLLTILLYTYTTIMPIWIFY